MTSETYNDDQSERDNAVTETAEKPQHLGVQELALQAELFDAGARSRPGHLNFYGGTKHGLRTDIEQVLNLLPVDSPLYAEFLRRMKQVVDDLKGDGQLSTIKRQTIRRLVLIDMQLDSFENKLLAGEIDIDPETKGLVGENYYLAKVNTFNKLAATLGLEKARKQAIDAAGEVRK